MATTASVERKTYGEDDSQFLDLYSANEPRGTVVSIHGGYWRHKYGLDLHVPIASHLVARGWTVANIEYRRAKPDGDGVWDDMSSDVLAAIEIVGDDAGPLVALGHSAGGQLALWAAAQPNMAIDAVVALAPVTDLFLADGLELSDHATKALMGSTAAERPDLYALASPLHLLPIEIPQLVVHGRNDDDVPFEMSTDYVEASEFAGDTIDFVDPKKVDHFHVIDPAHQVWRNVDSWLGELGR